jgi:cytochrome b pre-mRNA-processing protein 3
MKLLARIFGQASDPREQLRPLWHRVVAISREPGWYARGGIADSVAGRFDAITAVLALVLLRMEREAELTQATALLTELFVEDMDGQLRETGVGDPVVGKHVGRLVSSMGGRLGAYRDALARPDDDALAETVERNVTFGKDGDPATVANELRLLANRLDALPAARLLAGEIER